VVDNAEEEPSMKGRQRLLTLCLVFAASWASAAELLPARDALRADRPRLLLRPKDTPHAVSLGQLKALERDADFGKMLAQLKGLNHAAAQAMVWLLTGDEAAAEKAIERMARYDAAKGKGDAFEVYFRFREFALAYDWLYHHPKFTPERRAEIRKSLKPLADKGMKISDDHLFHNYVWMSAGGVGLWALATAGDDAESDALYDQVRERFNQRLFPGCRFMAGLPGDAIGYWAHYVFSPAALVLLGAQSSSDSALPAAPAKSDPWLTAQFQTVIHSTLPDLRFFPVGDLQSGPNGSVTHEMAGVMAGMSWALKSPQGAWFDRKIADRRGLGRFYGDTAIFYFLYARHLHAEPAEPALSFFTGSRRAGQWMARSGWDDDATCVAFRCTDFYGNHLHFDQGAFTIYRRGLLAVDPPLYRKVHGGQEKTEFHNTLLIDGQGQRRAKGQWFKTVEAFDAARTDKGLETGNILYHKKQDDWAAVAGQFAKAYPDGLVRSAVRHLLFLRPSTVAVFDVLEIPHGEKPRKVQWLLQLPGEPRGQWGVIASTTGKSWIRCTPVYPGPITPKVELTKMKTHRATYTYELRGVLMLVHVIDVGDGNRLAQAPKFATRRDQDGLHLTIGDRRFVLSPGRRGQVKEWERGQ
jgi:hypothetical protein